MAWLNIDTLKKLREETGVGFDECKKALEACLGHEDLAKQWLKRRGSAVYIKGGKGTLTKIYEEEAVERGPKSENYRTS